MSATSVRLLRVTLGAFLAICVAGPATAGAVSDVRVTEHVVPATALTGETVQARVTVTNLGDTPTEASTELRWEATDGEGFIVGDFVMQPAVCPPGTDDLGSVGECRIVTPIPPGASVTAVFSGSTRFPAVLEARASVVDRGTGLSGLDTKPLTITGPALPEPAGPRISHLTLDDRRLRPRERARLRFTLDRAATDVQVALWRCLGRAGCRRLDFIPNSVIIRRGRAGRNTLSYRLQRGLAPGRYCITASAREPFHRELPRSVTLRILRPRR